MKTVIIFALILFCGLSMSAEETNDNAFEQKLTEEKETALSLLRTRLKAQDKKGLWVFEDTVTAMWRGNNENFPQWPTARNIKLEARVRGFEIMDSFFDRSYDYDIRLGTRPIPPARIRNKNGYISGLGIDQIKDPEDREEFRVMIRKHRELAELDSFNRAVRDAHKSWQRRFIMFIDNYYLSSINYEPSRMEGFKKVEAIIEDSVKNKAVKKRLTDVVERLKFCPYKTVQEEVKTGKQLCKMTSRPYVPPKPVECKDGKPVES